MTLLTRLSLASLALAVTIALTIPGVIVVPYAGVLGAGIFLVFCGVVAFAGSLFAQLAVGLMTGPIGPRWRFPCAIGVLWPLLMFEWLFPLGGVRSGPGLKPVWAAVFGVIVVILIAAGVADYRRASSPTWSTLTRLFVSLGCILFIGAILLPTDSGGHGTLALVGAIAATQLSSQGGHMTRRGAA